MRNTINVLRAAEASLMLNDEGTRALVQAEIRRLIGMAPEFDLVVRWAAGEINDVPVSTITAAAAKVRTL